MGSLQLGYSILWYCPTSLYQQRHLLVPKVIKSLGPAFCICHPCEIRIQLRRVSMVWGTFQGWWNDQRMWLFKRTTSSFFGFTDNIYKVLGFSKSGFVVTGKVAEEDISLRYEKEVMEFGAPSPMFNILATLSLANLFSFVGALKMVIMDSKTRVLDLLALQTMLCGLVVLVNLPVYEGLFFRKDKGRMPTSIVYQSVVIAILAHIAALYQVTTSMKQRFH
ncbi:Cellulose synthase-like protein E6 [Camellia lanceoleosa]|uniref:Cellulose synthase-like protein E6 n=1 Tax=Camellia lanceoleosa TaxID=1840588 RepID=A0ACC0GM49_9ERIC|nr:Cellulose synthase-like protein E6 [Camellia lanceoleosa]